MSTAAEAVEVAHLHAPVATHSLWKRVLRNPMTLVPLIVLGVIVLAGVFGRVLAPHDPNATDIGNSLASPSGDQLAGHRQRRT